MTGEHYIEGVADYSVFRYDGQKRLLAEKTQRFI